MTNQQAFDGVWDRLVNHYVKGRCSRAGVGCLYIREDGNKCAIGALLPDSLCKELMDSRFKTTNIYGISSWRDRNGESAPLVALANKVMKVLDGVNISMLADLQEVHDRHYPKGIATVKAWLRYIAEKYKLVAPAPYPNEEVVTIEEY